MADVAGENGLFGHLADLWNGCIDDLRGYTKLEVPLRGPMTADAWEAIPEELRGDADHPLAARFHEIVRAAQAASVGKGACSASTSCSWSNSGRKASRSERAYHSACCLGRPINCRASAAAS